LAEGNFYIKLIVSKGTPAFDSDETELESRAYFTVPPHEIVVETKGFGYLKKIETGGTIRQERKTGHIKPEG